MSRPRLLAALVVAVVALAAPAAASADGPGPLYHWGFDGADSPGLQLHGGAAADVRGPVGAAVRFDGVDDYAAVPVVLAGANGVPYQALTVELWLRWDAYADDDRLALELSPNAGATPGTFALNPDDHRGAFFVSSQNGVDDWNDNRFPRPSAGAWHHYAVTVTRGLGAPYEDTVRVWVDGVEQPHDGSTNPFNHEFANDVLYLMSRGGTSLFGAGALDELAVYARALSPAEIAEHAAVTPDTTIVAGPDGSTSDPTFGFASDDPGASFECRIDDGAFAPCTSPRRYDGLALGAHAFAVRAVSAIPRTDPTPAERSFTLVAPPAAPRAQPALALAAGVTVHGATLSALRVPARAGSDRALRAALRRCAGRHGAARRAACRRVARTRLLPAISFSLDAGARVSFVLRRRAGGRTASFAVAGAPGANRVRWRTRVGRRALAPGRYTLTVELGAGAGARPVRSFAVRVR
jgi:hypothetical protein